MNIEVPFTACCEGVELRMNNIQQWKYMKLFEGNRFYILTEACDLYRFCLFCGKKIPAFPEE